MHFCKSHFVLICCLLLNFRPVPDEVQSVHLEAARRSIGEMSRKLPFEIVDLDPELSKEVCPCYSDDVKGFVQVGPQKWTLYDTYRAEAESFYNSEVRPDDVWICGLPRTGTTMLEELAWLILNDVDLLKVNANPKGRIGFFETRMLLRNLPKPSTSKEEMYIVSMNCFEEYLKRKERRIIKTHLPLSLLPPEVFTSGCKVIYTARNPKDVVVSWFHLQRNLAFRRFTGSFEQYFKFYLRDLILYSPFWGHVEQAWEKRNQPNFKFFFYETTTNNLRKTVEDVAELLEKELPPAQIDLLEQLLDFDTFKRLRSSHRTFDEKDVDKHFIRKGKIGGWKDYMSAEMAEAADRWIRKNSKLIGVDFPVV